jgi:hypothetical protein
MNIQIVLSELNKKMTDAKIGQAIGAPQSIVTRLRNGTHLTTYYERAKAIELLAIREGIDIFGDPGEDDAA